MFRSTGLFLLIGVPVIVLLALVLLWLTGTPAKAEEQIPCWKAQALKAWALGDEAKAEKMARKYGYSKAQIAETRERCKV